MQASVRGVAAQHLIAADSLALAAELDIVRRPRITTVNDGTENARPRYWVPGPWHLVVSALVGAVAANLPFLGGPHRPVAASSLQGRFSLFLVLVVTLLSVVIWTAAAAAYRDANVGIFIASFVGALSPLVGGACFGPFGLIAVIANFGDFAPLGVFTSLIVLAVARAQRRASRT